MEPSNLLPRGVGAGRRRASSAAAVGHALSGMQHACQTAVLVSLLHWFDAHGHTALATAAVPLPCSPFTTQGVMETAPASRGYQGGFGAPLMLKDLGLALQLAEGAGQPVPMGQLARGLYARVAEQRPPGQPPLDFSAIYEVVYGSRGKRPGGKA